MTPTDRRYTGQPAEGLGLYFYKARWYDVQLGRWSQPDSIIPDPYNPLDWDRYSYVQNNSIRFIDPTGHDRDCSVNDSYCNELRREYYYSDWQKHLSHLSFKDFQRSKEAYQFYYKYPDKAFEDMYVGEGKDSIVWGSIYSEYVLHRAFEPIPDFMVLDKIDNARATNNQHAFWTLLFGLGVQQYLSSDKGFGGGSVSWPDSPDEMDKLLGFSGSRIPDGPNTPGRSKVVWKPSDNITITYEQHPYDVTAPAWHQGSHWHIDYPGMNHRRYLPGDPMP